VWRNADRFEGNSQPSTWILAIARFKALSALRRRKEESLDEAAAAELSDPCDDPELSVEKKHHATLLRQCVSRLSAHHREIIDLIYYRDKSIAEAAEITGVPRNTVKTRMFHARNRMSAMLQQAGINRAFQ